MKNKMILITAFLLVGFTIFLPVFIVTKNGIAETITITIGVTLYHFIMRLAVGTIVNSIMKNKANHENIWFREKSFEKKLYRLIRVQEWKKHLPTYSPDTFDTSRKTVKDIIGATCQAEIVHEIIMVLSLLPIIVIPFLGGTVALIITSVFAMLFDSLFVILQRYNRPKLVRVMRRFQRIRKHVSGEDDCERDS
ncbi:MAG: hypothetical protein E7603_01830 [Ruminococcaceae bacterium]|nr:hypothetical protein [Oscillospiraceae bacterium]